MTGEFDPFGKLEELVGGAGAVSSRKQVTSQKVDYTGSPIETQFFNDIELILSPPSSLAQSQGEAGNHPVRPESSFNLPTPAGADDHGQHAVNRGFTVTSEQSAPAKRKKTIAKRSKAPTGSENGSDVEKKHACTICSSRFKMRGDLLRHVKVIHEGKKMYTCEICGKSFGHSGHLNRHVKCKHLAERRFQCQFCGFRFFQRSHLRSHIGHIHSGKKGHSCQECGFMASSKSALKNHMDEVHTQPEVAQSDVAGGSAVEWAGVAVSDNIVAGLESNVDDFTFDADFEVPVAFPSSQMEQFSMKHGVALLPR